MCTATLPLYTNFMFCCFFFLQPIHRQTQFSCTKHSLTRVRTWIEQGFESIVFATQERFTLSSWNQARLVAWNVGCPLSTKLIIMFSATSFHSLLCLLTWVSNHFFTTKSRFDQHPKWTPCGVRCIVHGIRCRISLISRSFPQNVIEHGHEDDLFLKLLRFIL